MSFSVRKLSLMGVLVALAIVLKLPILSVPNVEFFTFVVFSSGYLLGIIEGLLVGIISMSLYTSIITPYGLPPLPIAFAQVFSMALIGLAGGLASRLHLVRFDKRPSFFTGFEFLAMGLFGLGLTLIYDLFTNLATAYVVGQFLPVMIAAIPFALLHIFSNVAIFLLLTPVLLKLSTLVII
ncbi:MAG: ECF transporter S component [candidate division Zixibacteria bacterium]|nr:ECF transporter S component [candidate division Zixibacteria bacterium]